MAYGLAVGGLLIALVGIPAIISLSIPAPSLTSRDRQRMVTSPPAPPDEPALKIVKALSVGLLLDDFGIQQLVDDPLLSDEIERATFAPSTSSR